MIVIASGESGGMGVRGGSGSGSYIGGSGREEWWWR